MKAIHVLEALITSESENIIISEQEFIDIIELCLGNLQRPKSIKKVYEMVKREYDLEFPPKEKKKNAM